MLVRFDDGSPGRDGDDQFRPCEQQVSGRASRRRAAPSADRSLAAAIDEFSTVVGLAWGPVTRRKHADDFARFRCWLEASGIPATIDALEYLILARYVQDLRTRPQIHGVWRGDPDALERSLRSRPMRTLSANSVNAYVRPLRSLALWLVDEGQLPVNPFRKARHHAAARSLLPSEDTPTKSATLDDLRVLEHGCAGERCRSTCAIGRSSPS